MPDDEVDDNNDENDVDVYDFAAVMDRGQVPEDEDDDTINGYYNNDNNAVDDNDGDAVMTREQGLDGDNDVCNHVMTISVTIV